MGEGLSKIQQRDLVFLLAIILLGTSCDVAGVDSGGLEIQMEKQWVELVKWIDGDTSPTPTGSPSPTVETGTTGISDSQFSSAAAKKSKANAEILHEIFLVVFNREPKDRGE